MKVFISKYALSKGIIEVEAERYDEQSVYVKLPNAHVSSMFSGKNWHLTRKEAVDRAEAMRDAEIVRLEKKIQALKKLTF